MKKWLTSGAAAVLAAVAVLLVVLSSGCRRAQKARAATGETRTYEVLNTVEYTGAGAFSCQTAGTLLVHRRTLPSGEVSYDYTFNAEVSAGQRQAGAAVSFPAVSVLREPKTERFVGGAAFLRNIGVTANLALKQVRSAIRLDGTPETRTFQFNPPAGFPGSFSYEVTAHRQSLAGIQDAVAVLAVSRPFTYSAPGAVPVTAEHRMLCVTDATMDNVLYLCSRFTAAAAEGPAGGTLRIETLQYQLKDGQPVGLRGLDERFTLAFQRLGLAEAETTGRTSAGLPMWAMHSLAVRDAADLVAGAAIEGKPNFVITVTIGTVLLADSAVSAATMALHNAGVIDWEWEGIPNYIGQGAGLAAAKVYEDVTGTDVDEGKWREYGGLTGEVAGLAVSIFNPVGILDKGLEIGSAGIKAITAPDLAGKAIRLSKHGLDIVRAGKGWQSSVKLARELDAAQTMLDLILTNKDAVQLAEKYPPGAPSVVVPPSPPPPSRLPPSPRPSPPPPARPQRYRVTVTIEVDQRKPNGQPWDVVGPPDPRGRLHFPGGMAMTIPERSNSFTATGSLSGVRLTAGDKIEVFLEDADVRLHDGIASGFVEYPGGRTFSAKVGSATLSFEVTPVP